MQLVNISKVNEYYQIKALHPVKLFGMTLFSKVKAYSYSNSDNKWFETNTGKLVALKKKVKLDKWLKDHQKFIEKS